MLDDFLACHQHQQQQSKKMASVGSRVAVRFLQLKHRTVFGGLKTNPVLHQVIRNEVTNSKGALLPAPTSVRFGLPLVCIVVAPFMYVGATISKEGAAFLEENDIFVPEDDD